MAVGEIRAESARLGARHLRRLRHRPMSVVYDLAAGRDIVSLRVGARRVFIVNHPELIQQVLTRDIRSFRRGTTSQAHRLAGENLLGREGDAHDRQRGLVEPFFTPEAVRGYANLVTALAEERGQTWSDGAVRNVDDDMTDHVLDVIGTTLFGDDYASEWATVRCAYDASRTSIVLSSLLLPASRAHGSNRAALRRATERMLAARDGDGARDRDLLASLAGSVDPHGHGLTRGEIADEAWSYLAQGAPAHVVTWCWWVLSRYPEVENRFHAELEDVLGGRRPVAPDLDSLPFAHALVLEALRLYPPLWSIERVALDDYELGGVTIPAGATVLISPYVVHRDQRFWRNAQSFDPDRWLGAEARAIDRAAYLPFGAGERRCLGRHLVLMYAVLTLATLARDWRPHPLSPDLHVEAFPFFRPRGGLEVRLERRT